MKLLKYSFLSLLSIFFLGLTNATTLNFGLSEQSANIGKDIFVVGDSADYTKWFSLSTAWDLTTVGTISSQSALTANTHLIQFSSDGLKCFQSNRSNKLYKVDLTTAWDLTTKSSSSYEILTEVSYIKGMKIYSDKLFVVDSNKIVQYSLSSPFDVSTRTFISSYSTPTNTDGLYISKDGTKFFTSYAGGPRLYTYNLSTPFDISTISSYSYITLGFYQPQSFGISSDGLNLLIAGEYENKLYSYSLTTAWDLTTLSSLQSSLDLSSFYSHLYGVYIKEESLNEIDNFKTDFQVKTNMLDLNICGDYDVGDDLTLTSGSNILNGELSGTCFNFSYVPATTYQLELDGNELNKQYDGSSFNINNTDLYGFNNKIVDGSSSNIIGSISSINYTTTTNNYTIINVNGGQELVSLGLFDEITISNGNYIISNSNKNYAFNYTNNLYYYDDGSPTVLQTVALGDYSIYLSGIFETITDGNGDKHYYDENSEPGFNGILLSGLTTTGTLIANINTGNIFLPMQENVLKLFFANIPMYFIRIFGIMILFFLMRVITLKRK